MKIALIGYSGSGKSTLARRLSECYECPVLHFDQVNFLPGWVERDREEARALVAQFLDLHDSWIIDGNYGVFDEGRRFEEADVIIFLDYSRYICFSQAYRRYRIFRGKVRDDMADGCVEKFDFEFARWILFTGRNAHRKRFYKRIQQRYPRKILTAQNHTELENLLVSLP